MIKRRAAIIIAIIYAIFWFVNIVHPTGIGHLITGGVAIFALVFFSLFVVGKGEVEEEELSKRLDRIHPAFVTFYLGFLSPWIYLLGQRYAKFKLRSIIQMDKESRQWIAVFFVVIIILLLIRFVFVYKAWLASIVIAVISIALLFIGEIYTLNIYLDRNYTTHSEVVSEVEIKTVILGYIMYYQDEDGTKRAVKKELPYFIFIDNVNPGDTIYVRSGTGAFGIPYDDMFDHFAKPTSFSRIELNEKV